MMEAGTTEDDVRLQDTGGDSGGLSKQEVLGLDEDSQQARRAALTRTKSLEQRVSLPQELLVVGCICLAMFTTQAGLGICIDLLHVIGDHFGITDPGVLSWLIAGYSLTVGTFILFTGRIGDLFGWKRMFLIGFVWFALWSLVCGMASYSKHVLFVFARVLQGIGPAIVLPNGLALLGALYQPGPRKNMVFAVFGACAPTGFIVGSTFAGMLWLAWWPWAFFSFAITLTIITIVSALIIPNPQEGIPCRKGKSLRDTACELDLGGATTGITALVLFNFAWNQAPIVGWDKAYVIVCLLLGVVLAALFFYIETKISPHPILPLDVFNSSNAFVLACVACGWACFGIWFYYLWQILQVLRRASPLLSVAYFVPNGIAGAVAAVVSGLLLGRLRPAWLMTIATSAFLIGIILIATVPPDQIYWGQIFVSMFITPFGMDMSFPSATIVISDSMRKEHQGVAASLVNTIVNYSISLGLGFAGTIDVHINPGGTTASETLRGYRAAMYFGIGLAGLGLAVAVMFLVKSYWDDHKQQKREKGDNESEGQAVDMDRPCAVCGET